MSDPTTDSEGPVLADDQTVYRTATRKSWVRRNGAPTLELYLSSEFQPAAEAFLRRASDHDGLSVHYNLDSPDEIPLQTKWAIFSLLTGRIHQIPGVENRFLRIVPDDLQHALIRGLPEYSPDPTELALNIATSLVAITDPQPYWVHPKLLA